MTFFKKPKEMLPIISKMFGTVFEKQKESPVINSKCAQYYGLLEEDPEALEKQFIEFSEQVWAVPDQVFKQTAEEINSLVLIYKKPAESFTKDLNYFVMQRWGYQDEGIGPEGRRKEK